MRSDPLFSTSKMAALTKTSGYDDGEIQVKYTKQPNIYSTTSKLAITGWINVWIPMHLEEHRNFFTDVHLKLVSMLVD